MMGLGGGALQTSTGGQRPAWKLETRVSNSEEKAWEEIEVLLEGSAEDGRGLQS